MAKKLKDFDLDDLFEAPFKGLDKTMGGLDKAMDEAMAGLDKIFNKTSDQFDRKMRKMSDKLDRSMSTHEIVFKRKFKILRTITRSLVVLATLMALAIAIWLISSSVEDTKKEQLKAKPLSPIEETQQPKEMKKL